MSILGILDLTFFCLLLIPVLYVGIFSVASSFRKKNNRSNKPLPNRKYLVLYPAYQEDAVIVQAVETFFKQTYPRAFYDLVVISDHMQPDTNLRLENLSADVILADYENSSKTKAMRLAMRRMEELRRSYDFIVVMDADNLVDPSFLQKINDAFPLDGEMIALQGHRIAKNINTDIALLDAISEEINNTIFREGHNRVGLSASLSGSGMAFDYEWFKTHIFQIGHVGEDKQIEFFLKLQRVYIRFLDDVYVLDEKIQKMAHFSTQRRRWIATQFVNLADALRALPHAIVSGNINLLNTVFQWMHPPRLIVLGLTFLGACILSFLNIGLAYKWWILFGGFCLILFNAVPRRLINKRLFKTVIHLPVLFLVMWVNLFRIRGANKKFIHTEHTI